MLSLGLAIIFGLLNIINVTHGAQYMMGAFCAWLLLNYLGIGYWPALIIAPLIVGATGLVLERVFLRRVYKLDHIYGFLLTLGLSLLIEGAFRQRYGISGQALRYPRSPARRLRSRLPLPARLSGLDHRLLADGVLRHMVPDRTHPARRHLARGDRESGADAGVRHQRAAHDHADLRLRRRACGSRRRDGGADLPGRLDDGRQHPRASCSPSS